MSDGAERILQHAGRGVRLVSLASSSQGAKTLTATYIPDTSNFTGSSPPHAHQVNPAPALTVITSDSPDPSTVGQAYSVGVRVLRSSGTGTPIGHGVDHGQQWCDLQRDVVADE